MRAQSKRPCNQVARALVLRASAFDVNRIRFESPLMPLLRFTVGTGLAIVAPHDRTRHRTDDPTKLTAAVGERRVHQPR